MKYSALILILCLSLSLFAQKANEQPAYMDTSLPIETRVIDLISRMTLEEKVSQMLDKSKAIPHLNILEYDWWNEGLHGVARAGRATVFPQAIGMAATFNTELIYEVADAISTEARAKHHEAARKGDYGRYKGLTFWSPNINIFRDPRWGRGQETYGEDPYLSSRMGVAFIRGLQGNHPHYLKLVATPKHYAVHSGPEPERHAFDAVTSKRDLFDTYLPAFEAAIKEAKAYSVMCAYNSYLGEPCCSSSSLQNEILRELWGFEGYIVSDCGAIDDIVVAHKIVDSEPEAAALAVKGGTDLNCGDYRIGRYHVYSSLIKAVELGLISEEEINLSVKRLFLARFKLGMFDPPEKVPYNQIPYEKNDCEEHRQLSRKAAQESIVLLKNKDDLLPLDKDLKRIAVIGPTADSYSMLLGNYYGTPSKYVTPLQGIRNKLPNAVISYEPGCNTVEKGGIIKHLTAEMLSFDGSAGLRAEYFNNTSLSGEAFFSKIDPLNIADLIRGAQIPELQTTDSFSIRWSGKLNLPVTGIYNFILSGGDGYRLIINDHTLIEDWSEHEITTKRHQIKLEKNKSYDFVLEYFHRSGRALPSRSGSSATTA